VNRTATATCIGAKTAKTPNPYTTEAESKNEPLTAPIDTAVRFLFGGKELFKKANVISNGIVPAIVAVCYSLDLLSPEQALVAFTTSIGAATADTMASEIGVLAPEPVLITNPSKKVEPGTDGGVSLEGTTASLLSAVSMSMLSFCAFVLMIGENDPLYSVFEVDFLYISAFFGFFGSIIDSLLGATLENRGILGNNGVNFCSISGAVLFSLLFLETI